MSRAAGNSNDLVEIDYPDFKVEHYIHEYKGRSRIMRLMFIADHCPSARETATKLLMQVAEGPGRDSIVDVRVYRDIFNYGKKYLKIERDPDEKFLKQLVLQNQVQRTKLDDEIQKWRNLSQKGNSRIAHLKYAEFLSRMGEFDLAIHNLNDAKEYTSTTEEMVECCLQIIFTSVKQGSLGHVQFEANRLLVMNREALTWNTLSQVHACLGLFFLRNKKFSMASSHFLQATRLGNFSEILSKRDVGVYAALCALAVLNRDSLKAQLLENSKIMGYLNRAPIIKRLANAMHDSKYSIVMATLADLMKDFRLDYYLHSVADAVVDAVRGKALVQYFEPFSSMNLSRMARDFGVALNHIEDELRKAILSGQVKAKIDLANHTLIEHQDVADRHAILKTIVEEGEHFSREAMIVMLNLSLKSKKMDLEKKEPG